MLLVRHDIIFHIEIGPSKWFINYLLSLVKGYITFCPSFRTAKTSSTYNRLERFCQCKKTSRRGLSSVYLVIFCRSIDSWWIFSLGSVYLATSLNVNFVLYLTLSLCHQEWEKSASSWYTPGYSTTNCNAFIGAIQWQHAYWTTCCCCSCCCN